MKETTSLNTQIPDIVNEKCSQAYEQIRNDACLSRRRRINKKTVGIVCAAAVALCAAVPAAASIPAVKNVFGITSQQYSKDPKTENNLTAYAKPVGISSSSELADISIEEVYFDGNDISFTALLTTDAQQFEDCSSIVAEGMIFVNNTMLENQNLYFGKNEDGNFYAVYSANISEMNVTDEADVDICITSLYGGNSQIMIYDENAAEYTPFETESYQNTINISFTAEADSSEIKTYEVNESYENITLNSITVSPFRTAIDISGLGERQSYRVKDNNGNEYETIDNGIASVQAPLKSANAIEIEIFNLDQDDFPTLYTFTVPIDKGYRIDTNAQYKKEEITYIPPLEETDKLYNDALEKAKQLFNENKVIVDASKEVDTNLIDSSSYESENAKVKISISDVISDFSDYDLDIEYYDESIEDPVLMLVDYEITNTSDKDESFFFCGYTMIDDNYEYVATEPNYRETRDYGGKSGYIFDFAAGETRTITFGYIVSADAIENSLYAVPTGDIDIYNLAEYILTDTVDDYTENYNYTLLKIK